MFLHHLSTYSGRITNKYSLGVNPKVHQVDQFVLQVMHPMLDLVIFLVIYSQIIQIMKMITMSAETLRK